MTTYFDAIQKRRSRYALSPALPISEDRLLDVIGNAVRHAPSPYNSQGSKAVVLLGEHHTALWDITLEALRKVTPAKRFPATQEKVAAFAHSYGTVLFFDDTAATDALSDQFPLYAANFRQWAQHATGIQQYAVWTSLAAEGIGASLQHYGELIQADVRAKWDIPESWHLIAQMPFGTPTAPDDEKDFLPEGERMRIVR